MMCKNNALLVFLAGIGIFFSCTTLNHPNKGVANTDQMEPKVNPVSSTDTFLLSLLKKYPPYFSDILNKYKDRNVQIMYTQINRKLNGIPDLTHHYFNIHADQYFYPASTVKLPVVLLALQKLHELKDKGIDRNTTMLTETACSGQTPVFNDPTTPDGRPTIAHYIKKILMVSDNDAYNRLYEFLGQTYINTELKKKGYEDVQILHRLNIFLSEEENRQTNPVKFYDGAGKLMYSQAEQKSHLKYAERKDSIGTGFYKGDQLIAMPMDFSKKNRISLHDLHQILISLVFPEKVKSGKRFNISEEDRLFVLKYMSQYPTESMYPPYAADTVNYWPAYCKFMFYGAEKVTPNESIRIFNKVGDAYGQMVDVAYVVDFKNNIEFFLSAAIYCNSDGILNDDKYDYNSIGLPFLKNLGRVIYDDELKRPYKRRPNLSSILFTYDK